MGAERRARGAGDWTPEQWRSFLERRLGGRIEVAFGRSRSYPVQVRTEPDGLRHLRLHDMFRLAPDEVADALSGWMRAGQRAPAAGRVLDDWIHARLSETPAAPRALSVEPHGECYDLERLAAGLYRRELRAELAALPARPTLTWGRRCRSRSRSSLRLGSYVQDTNLVRIHPVLDQPAVPEWFVRAVLFHELLHAALPPRQDERGRWLHHPPEFQRRERQYADYARSLVWQEQNLARLIRSARSGSRLRARDGGRGSGRW